MKRKDNTIQYKHKHSDLNASCYSAIIAFIFISNFK